MAINPVDMGGGDFAEWAEKTYGIDYDDISLLDMLRTLDTQIAEQPTTRKSIPADLRDILLARKAKLQPMVEARETEQAAAVAEAEKVLAQPEPWTKAQWQVLVKAGYARVGRDDDDEGYSVELIHRGRGDVYGDQAGIDG
jgi:hypothetical protein